MRIVNACVNDSYDGTFFAIGRINYAFKKMNPFLSLDRISIAKNAIVFLLPVDILLL